MSEQQFRVGSLLNQLDAFGPEKQLSLTQLSRIIKLAEVKPPCAGNNHSLDWTKGVSAPMGRVYPCENCDKRFRPVWEVIE